MNPSQFSNINRCIQAAIGMIFLNAACVLALPTDKNQNIVYSAKTATASQKEGTVVLTGAVKLTQGSLEINADKITLHTDSNQKLETVTAEGSPARYQQQLEEGKPIVHAEASSITYRLKKEQLTLDKNAFIEQNGATTKGGRIDYDVNNGSVKASGEGDESGRVEFVIPPQQTDKKE